MKYLDLILNNDKIKIACIALIITIIFIILLIFILKKSSNKKKKENTFSNNNIINETVSNNIETKDQPKIKENEFMEEPALNTEETIKEASSPTNNSYIRVEEEKTSKIDEDIISAFDIELEKEELETINFEEKIDNIVNNDLFIANEENVEKTLNENSNTNPPLHATQELDIDMLEETLELPKMVNDEINNNITATKKCNNCGFENAYSSKNCYMCGEPLE